MAAHHSTITVTRPHRPDASVMCPYAKNFVALVGPHGLMLPPLYRKGTATQQAYPVAQCWRLTGEE